MQLVIYMSEHAGVWIYFGSFLNFNITSSIKATLKAFWSKIIYKEALFHSSTHQITQRAQLSPLKYEHNAYFDPHHIHPRHISTYTFTTHTCEYEQKQRRVSGKQVRFKVGHQELERKRWPKKLVIPGQGSPCIPNSFDEIHTVTAPNTPGCCLKRASALVGRRKPPSAWNNYSTPNPAVFKQVPGPPVPDSTSISRPREPPRAKESEQRVNCSIISPSSGSNLASSEPILRSLRKTVKTGSWFATYA